MRNAWPLSIPKIRLAAENTSAVRKLFYLSCPADCLPAYPNKVKTTFMSQSTSASLQQFNTQVGIKFQLYNSLFTSLPFHRIEKTGILLSLLLSNCEEGYRRRQSPLEIIDDFFARQTSYTTEQEKLDLLFRFVQYVERQVVLFDALEDAAFRDVNDMGGSGTLKQLEGEVAGAAAHDALAAKLNDFAVRLVLTAHPTQFYPGTVLGIINDLSRAIAENNVGQINSYLQQLGKTPFFKKQKPTPYDEAISLIWYLENVFYNAGGRILQYLRHHFPDAVSPDNPVIHMGFWPGGDRDGNPFVTADITWKVAEALRGSIIKCYYMDIRRLRRRLTFEGVDQNLQELEKKLYNNIFIPGQRTDLQAREILDTLEDIRNTLIYQHNGLFVNLVNQLITRVTLFGLHFASLDIRQDSAVHGRVLEHIAGRTGLLPEGYASLPAEEKIRVLSDVHTSVDMSLLDDALARDTIESMQVVKQIQEMNGMEGCHRYIISQCNHALNPLEVLALFRLSGWTEADIPVDIVPLFETVDDLLEAENTMRLLYTHPLYAAHLKHRGNRQTIMLGFSDGTKDGGYLMANFGIYKAKEDLTRISRDHGVDVIFFDGRGGPPARGGGKTHKFYASLGQLIANKEIQLTIQGQTVSSNFGTIDAAQFNIEQLIHAGISNDLFPEQNKTMDIREASLLQELSQSGYEAYRALRDHPYFLEYLGHASPLRFYAETNIGSRPAKRGASGRLTLKDLRAIPYVGAWSQLKQNVTGYYGVGMALQKLDEAGRLEEARLLYRDCAFFKTLMDNCEMAMKKCFFPLTAFLSEHPVYGEIWSMIYQEYERTKRYLFRLSGHTELMADYPVEQVSVQMRERIVLPLTTIQQYAITRVREMEEQRLQSPVKQSYEKLVMRCSFGIINAGRNSA
jgi:phosphoenolpyruvate carboxylase